MTPGVWTNGKTRLTGSWEWIWPSQCFVIELDRRDRITRMRRRFTAFGDAPEWGSWRLVRDVAPVEEQAPAQGGQP